MDLLDLLPIPIILVVLAGIGYGVAKLARRSNTQVHRINQRPTRDVRRNA